MISNYLKRWRGPFGLSLLDWLAKSDITPNQITCIGLTLVLVNCALYPLHRDIFWFGVGLSLSSTFDALDGFIARRQGTQSHFGGYLDAVTDRYQEIAAYLVIAWVNDCWPVIFFVVTGSLLVSYTKARTAIEIPIDNKGWPDMLDRSRRMWILGGTLILDGTIPMPAALGGRLLYPVLIVFAVLTHFTAVQRFFRASRSLLAFDQKRAIR